MLTVKLDRQDCEALLSIRVEALAELMARVGCGATDAALSDVGIALGKLVLLARAMGVFVPVEELTGIDCV